MIHHRNIKQIARAGLFETFCSLSEDMFLVKTKRATSGKVEVRSAHTRLMELGITSVHDTNEIAAHTVETHPLLIHLERNSINSSYRAYAGSPNRLKVFKDVVYVPQFHCLYDQDGRRIESSCYKTKLKQLYYTPETIRIESSIDRFDEEVIYASDYSANMHYGHFLIEAISSLWYTTQEVNAPILTNTIPRPFKKTFVDDFLNLYWPRHEKETLSFSKPVLLRSAVVPYPSFTFCSEAYTVHRSAPEKVASLVLENKKVVPTEQPLYLSRTKLIDGNRSISGEIELEQTLKMKGFQIAYPERLSLAEQIYLFNKHDTVIGCRGSALHGILFDLSQKNKLICLSDSDRIDKAFLMIDAIKAIDSTYIGALKRKEAGGDKHWKMTRFMDVSVVLDALKSMGLI